MLCFSLVYLHSMSQVIDISYMEMINSLKCRTELNDILINNAQELLDVDEDSIII
jgi:hypothetical protein